MRRALTAAIILLALVDGLVHLYLGAVLMPGFTHTFFSQLGILFLLNFLGYAALSIAFWRAQSSTLSQRRMVGWLLAVYPIVTLIAWVYFTGGKGNPRGTAYISKPVEILLFVAALLSLRQLGQENRAPIMASRS